MAENAAKAEKAEKDGGGGHGKGGDTDREAYAFACLSCGYGWEQAYEIEHHVDPHGRPFVVYRVDGRRVPSPLTRPACRNCGGPRVRVMRPGLVAAAERARPGAH